MIAGAQNSSVSQTPLTAASIKTPTISKRPRLFCIISRSHVLQIMAGKD
jgi:hypothetical protein